MCIHKIVGTLSTTASIYSCAGEQVTFECTSNTSTLMWKLTTLNTTAELNRNDLFSQNMKNYSSPLTIPNNVLISEIFLERISKAPLRVNFSVIPVVYLLNGGIIECSSGSGQTYSQNFTIYVIGKM